MKYGKYDGKSGDYDFTTVYTNGSPTNRQVGKYELNESQTKIGFQYNPNATSPATLYDFAITDEKLFINISDAGFNYIITAEKK